LRKYAILNNKINNVEKIMLYKKNDDVYLFFYDSDIDSPGFADKCVNTISDAEEICLEEFNVQLTDWILIKDPLEDCLEEFNVQLTDWILIKDPLEDCQDDLISPIRVKGRNLKQPKWGEYEILVNN